MIRTGEFVIVAGLISAKEAEPQAALDELAARVVDRGGVVVGRLLQRRGVSRDRRPGGAGRMDRPLSPATLIGSGKVRELAELCRTTGAVAVVFCNPLSPTQRRGLEAACGARVLDANEL